MSIENRDWYRDLLRQRAGMKPKWQLWRTKRPLMPDGRPNPLYVRPAQPWHWTLHVVLWLIVLAVVMAALKLIL